MAIQVPVAPGGAATAATAAFGALAFLSMSGARFLGFLVHFPLKPCGFPGQEDRSGRLRPQLAEVENRLNLRPEDRPGGAELRTGL